MRHPNPAQSAAPAPTAAPTLDTSLYRLVDTGSIPPAPLPADHYPEDTRSLLVILSLDATRTGVVRAPDGRKVRAELAA